MLTHSVHLRVCFGARGVFRPSSCKRREAILARFGSRIVPSGALEALRRAFGFAVPNVLMQATSIRLRTSISAAVPLVVRIALAESGAQNVSSPPGFLPNMLL